ncbi:8254_t:CDS:2, partial [Dentiscutata erythropus]
YVISLTIMVIGDCSDKNHFSDNYLVPKVVEKTIVKQCIDIIIIRLNNEAYRISKQLKQIRSLRKCEQLKVLHKIKNNPSTMLNHIIPVFVQLNDNDFNSAIKQIYQQIFDASTLFQTMTYSRGIHKGKIISTHLQKKALKFVDSGLYKHHYTINTLESRSKFFKKEIRQFEKNRLSLNTKVHSLSMQLVKAKQSKKKQISKIQAAIQKAKQIKPTQFRNAVKELNYLDFFEEFKAFANSNIMELEKFLLVYKFLKFHIWNIIIHQQQLEGLFNHYDMKIHPNMNIHLQKSRIQLSGLDGRIQEIS